MLFLMQQILERAARESPDRPAFRFMDESLSYAGLDAASSRLALYLVEHGVQRGDRVAILLNKSLECAIAVYGILKSGAAYVPLDPGAPQARLRDIVTQSGTRWLVSHDARSAAARRLVEECPEQFAAVVGLACEVPGAAHSISWAALSDREVTALDYRGRTADDVAYIMYTSGSTGVPKGIVHSHRSGLSYALMAAELYELTPADRLSNLPPLHFDQSIFDYFSGPAAGACTVIISEAHARLPASLSELMQREQLTVWYSVPFALVQLALHGVLESRDLRSLRCVKFGGEPFPAKHLASLMEAWPRARFCNVYGPAEVNQCTWHFVDRNRALDTGPVPIGMECPNAEILLLDESDEPVPAGSPGELLVRTPTMMRGYFQRPELNAGAFFRRDNPDGTSDRFYRTGDLALRNDSGELMFLGRRDRLVKLRGYRVELDEIEAVFDRHPDVEQSATFVIRTADQVPSLRIAVCLRGGADCDEKRLRSHATGLLPAYAVPDVVYLIDSFPRTSSGKIDRNSLRTLLERPQAGRER